MANKKLLHEMKEAQKGVWDLSDRDKAMALHPQVFFFTFFFTYKKSDFLYIYTRLGSL
jgi:hypothetical protein